MTRAQIRMIRQGLGKTQQQMADTMGVSRRTISSWERGQHPIPTWAEKFCALIPMPQGVDNPPTTA